MAKIKDWLESLELGKYLDLFEKNDIEWDVLGDLTEEDLVGLGISLGDRKRMIQAMKDMPGHVCAEIPSIIGIPLNSYYEERNPVLKLWYACDVVESFLRLVVMMAVADLKRDQDQIARKIARELRDKIEMPTLGKWQAMSLILTKAIPQAERSVPEMYDFLLNSLVSLLEGEETNKSPENSFLLLRNRLAHGGGMTRSAADDLVGIWAGRFETMVAGMTWLTDLSLVILQEDRRLGVLKGYSSEPEEYSPANAEMKTRLMELFTQGEEVVLVRERVVLPLWPLALFDIPRLADTEEPAARKQVPQLYVRRADSHLHFTPVGSEESCHSEIGGSALASFRAFFRLDDSELEEKRKGWQVMGFESDLRREAGRLIGKGRMEHRDRIIGVLSEASEGIFWLSGQAGIGKSCVVSSCALEIMERKEKDCLVLAYKFREGDYRCSRDSFLLFAIERLEQWEYAREEASSAASREPLQRLRDLLEKVQKGRVIIFLDGLDEIARRDPSFAEEVPLSLALPHVIWCCAGRPEPVLEKAFAPGNCTRIFKDGLPMMDHDDIRAMLLEHIGSMSPRLLTQDQEEREGEEKKVVNRFVERIIQVAQGLPLYVNYVIGDIWAGEFRTLDVGERLPPSLDHYHAKLIKRYSLSSLGFVLTPLASSLAVAYEALSARTLEEILAFWRVVKPETASALVEAAISALSTIVRRTPEADGGTGYALFHTSLRQHMQVNPEICDTVELARGILTKMALSPDESGQAISPYLYRWGVSHMLDQPGDETARELVGMLSDVDYLNRKQQAQRLGPFLQDLGRAYNWLTEKQIPERGQIVQVAFTIIYAQIYQERWDIEEIHALMAHGVDRQLLYERLLRHAAGRPADTERDSFILAGFQARLANMLRRESADNFAEAEELLANSLELMQRAGAAVDWAELSRIKYDIAYMAFMRGETDKALDWFAQSAADAERANNLVGYWITRCIEGYCRYLYGRCTAFVFEAILHEARPVFVDTSEEEGNQNALRWIFNVHSFLFLVQMDRGNLEETARLFDILVDDRWSEESGQAEKCLVFHEARLRLLEGKYEKAIELFVRNEEIAGSPRESESRDLLDYGRALKGAGRLDEALAVWARGLECADGFGNGPFKERIREEMRGIG